MLGRMLGPTADYIGEGVRALTERRVGNVQRVFKKAHDKLGPDLDRPGAIPPRVLKGVLECPDAQVLSWSRAVTSRAPGPRELLWVQGLAVPEDVGS